MKEWTNSIGMVFVSVPGGVFSMGSEKGRPNEYPPHEAAVPDFWLAKYPVTQAQWDALMFDNFSRFKRPLDNPMHNVSWVNAQEFVARLNQREGFRRYRLPGEAEWEYACRAGSPDRYCFGDDEARLADYAWHEGNARRVARVGRKRPNAFGLHDMHGNVWEWVEDEYLAYPGASLPRGWPGECRVLRGGGWRTPAVCCTACFRVGASPHWWTCDVGFRVAFSA